VSYASAPGRWPEMAAKAAKRATSDELLTAQQLADLLHVGIQSVYDWRHRGMGPRGIRPAGGKLLFRRSDVDAWLDQYADRPGAA
jgi:excisionase family DNA binding protein